MRERLLLLYPEAWRARYGEEMAALLEDTPPGFIATLDLLRGAAIAHLRARPAPLPAVRARSTIAGVLRCFIIFCAFGSAFAKTTENDDGIEHLHPLLGVSHSLIVIGAIVAIAALALAAGPLVVVSLAEARRTRQPALIKLIAVPPAAVGALAGSLGLLALWLNAHHRRADAGAWLLLGLCALCAGIGGVACWAAPRAIMRRVEVPRRAFALSIPAVALVAASMLAIAVATGLFLIGVVADAPQIGTLSNGPGQLISVTASIAVQFAAMLGLGALAAVSAVRGLRSVRALAR